MHPDLWMMTYRQHEGQVEQQMRHRREAHERAEARVLARPSGRLTELAALTTLTATLSRVLRTLGGGTSAVACCASSAEL